ncbi:Ig-like domain repeat protein [Nocardioides dongkuii]|uniref:Ig-like domain repeat protein n=1 Tax=Nocardioides dongkuii TaxID=2760089 RepID=UPI0018777FEF|nr:Ig-like domain repeat protein [Nocardioides dongkuii]
MKKLIVALFAAILTTAGLVAVSSAPASAACKKSDYNCVATKPKPKAPRVVKPNKPAKVKIDVRAKGASNITPTGTVKITVKGPGGFTRVIKATYDGKTLKFKLGKLKKAGIYTVTVKFNGDRGFENSDNSTKITVKKKN